MSTVSAGPEGRSGGELVVEVLRAQGVDRVFCVPGESYLPVLDALRGSGIDVVTARHEGGAAMMAEADGKLTGRPGVALVTRGPGATNAASGVHVARQDSTPLVLLVGQVPGRHRGRDAFQELDYRQTFRDLAKWVDEIDRVERIPELFARAWHVALSGRPGPVVLALPEDVLRERSAVLPGPRVEPLAPGPTPEQVAALVAGLGQAQRPLMILGGSRWTFDAAGAARAFAEASGVPVAVSFRRQQLFDHDHPLFAGHVGLGVDPQLAARIEDADLVLLVGGRFSESPSQGYGLLEVPRPRQVLVHVHPGAEELGRVYHPHLAIQATPETFFRALAATAVPRHGDDGAAHRAYEAWSRIPNGYTEGQGVDPGAVVRVLRARLPDDAILTNGAGNYAIWLHRHFRFRRFGTQLAPTSGSMGYGLPAAVAAALRHGDRPVVCLAGDGCFQMTGQELGTAVQHRAALVVLVLDNGMYGTIRMHQERHHPGRPVATDLVNPDFAALAAAYGLHGETVRATDAFPGALDRALDAAAARARPALLHLLTDPAVLAPGTVLRGSGGAGSPGIGSTRPTRRSPP